LIAGCTITFIKLIDDPLEGSPILVAMLSKAIVPSSSKATVAKQQTKTTR
jgi:hypothetical protein